MISEDDRPAKPMGPSLTPTTLTSNFKYLPDLLTALGELAAVHTPP